MLVFSAIYFGFLQTGQKMVMHTVCAEGHLYPQASVVMLCNLEFQFLPSIVLCFQLEMFVGIY